MAADRVLEGLWERQAARQMNDSQLAELLGVSQATISYLKSGKKRLGRGVLNAVLRVFPELGYAMVATAVADSASPRTPEAVETARPPP